MHQDSKTLDAFARGDGFGDWAELRSFWSEEHPGVGGLWSNEFWGFLIEWKPIEVKQ